nr:hypothetical protein GCM10025699_34550 [Microbacterium flavescens]
MNRSPGLSALTRRRFATPRSAALVIIALTAFAAFVIAAAPRALVGVVRAEVAHQVSDMPAISRDLAASLIGSPAFGPVADSEVADGWDEGAGDVFGTVGQLLADNRESLEPALAPLVGEAEFAAYSQDIQIDPEDLDPQAPISIMQLFAEPAMQSNVELVDGTWPEPWTGTGPVEIVLSEAAAETMLWPIGEVRSAPPSTGVTSVDDWFEGHAEVELVGTVSALDPGADRWTHLPTALTATVYDDGNRRPTATSVAWVHPDSWAQLAPRCARSFRRGIPWTAERPSAPNPASSCPPSAPRRRRASPSTRPGSCASASRAGSSTCCRRRSPAPTPRAPSSPSRRSARSRSVSRSSCSPPPS